MVFLAGRQLNWNLTLKRYKILYIPEARYVLMGYNNSLYFEKEVGMNAKLGTLTQTPQEYIKAIITWSRSDAFFRRNEIPFPVSSSEFEIVEIEDDN